MLVSYLHAGAVYYTNYTTRQSLISNNVYNVYRDSRGYMWFATDKGISRFDGKEFKNYTTLDGLGDNEVFGFYEDKAQRLWLYTYNGSPCYLRNDSVFNAGNDPLLGKMPVISFMNTMYSPDNTSLYIGYRFGEIIKISGNRIIHIRGRRQFDELTSIYPSGGMIYAVSSDSLHTIEGDKLTNSIPLSSKSRAKYNNGMLLLSDRDGLKILRNNQQQFVYVNNKLSINYVINMRSDTSANIFVSTTDGLHVLNTRNRKIITLFKGERISNVAQDICGNYWVASFGKGIFCVNSELDNLKLVLHMQNAMEYQNTSSQFFLWQSDTLYHFYQGTFAKEILPFPFHNNYLPLHISDSLLFFYKEGNTYVFNRKKRIMHITQVSPKWVFPAKDRYLFISNYWGSIHSIKIKKDESILDDTLIISNTITHTVRSFFDQRLYLTTRDSLYRVNEKDVNIKKVTRLPRGRKIMNMVGVNGYIILLTNTNELVVYNIAAGYKCTILSTEGINFYHLADLGNGRYLAHTNKGYYIFSFTGYGFPVMQKIEYPFRSEQLFSVNVSGDKLLCNVNGDYYIIDRQLVNKQLERPVFKVKNITVNGRQYKTGDITVGNARKGDIHLELNTLHFNSTANSYQYRIHSNDGISRWYRSSGDNLNVLIPGHGDYKLQLRAITENNRVSPSVFLSIRLIPPFYYSMWFKAFATTFLAACILYSIYFYNRRRRKIFQKRLDHLKLEHRALNSLLNPHFTFNAINNIQNLVNEKDTDKANDYLAALSKLIRQNMENLRFSLVPVEKELTLVTNYIYLQNLRFDNRIKLTILNQLPQGQEINVPPLLIHTFVENAVVHGFDRKKHNFTIIVDISLSVDDYIIISIRDNGVGMKATRKDYSHLHDKTSLGIDITRTRLQRLSQFYKVNYSIDILDITGEGDNTGTEVIITLYSKFREAVL